VACFSIVINYKLTKN